MSIMQNRRRSGLLARSGRFVLGTAFVLGLSACDLDEVLQVDDPEFPTDESLRDPTALPLLINGALGEFFRGYSGNGLDNLGYVTASALFTDEFQSSDTFVDRNAVDRRDLQSPALGNPSDLAFSRLQRARRATQDAAAAVEQVRGANDPDRAILLAINGYSLVALAEGYCSAVPLSNVVDGVFEEGAPQSTEQLLELAIQRFDESLAADANSLARVGKGRALLNLGRFQEAAAAVNPVSTEFEFLVEHSENTFQNPVWRLNNDNIRFTALGNEGVNGLDFRTANDPRVVVTRQGDRMGFDTSIPLWEQQKYPNRDADVPLADGIEARLIEAEAALQSNDVGTFLGTLNALRAGVAGLAPLADPGSQDGRVDLLFRERAFWMYLTGHRLGDLRRLVNQYGRSVNEVYPVGTDTHNQAYGDDVVFSVPFEEEQNSLFQRSACVTTET